jgi:hypothetical protein
MEPGRAVADLELFPAERGNGCAAHPLGASDAQRIRPGSAGHETRWAR